MSSTWSVCGKVGAEAFTHRHLSPEKKRINSQLDHIIGPMRRSDEIYIHNARRLYGQFGTTTLFSREHKKNHTSKSFKKGIKKWTGWGDKEENLSTVQKIIENALKKIQHRTNAQKEKEMMRTPQNVRLREEAVARCTAKIKRIVLRRQARKARAEHLVRCSLEPGKKKTKRKPLTELYVKGHFTEDRAE